MTERVPDTSVRAAGQPTPSPSLPGRGGVWHGWLQSLPILNLAGEIARVVGESEYVRLAGENMRRFQTGMVSTAM